MCPVSTGPRGWIPGPTPSLASLTRRSPPPTDVPTWLKSLRLHKYAALFSQMSYEEMMTLTEQHLESQVTAQSATGKRRRWPRMPR